MRLAALAIRNFRVLKSARLSFPDQVVGIIGPNGSGKSSIVEAIAWALYGNRVARSARDEITSIYSGADETCEVDLEFALAREHYRLTRRLLARGRRTEVTLSRGGSAESAGSTETERYVAQLLGLDWRGFLTSFLARQQELNALADLAPGQRREHLAGMLGIDRLDQALRAVKEDRRVLQQTVAGYRHQQGHRELVSRQLIELREHLRRLERQRDNLLGAQTAAQRSFEQSDLKYREHQALAASCSQLQARMESLAGTLQPVEQQHQDLCSQEKRFAVVEEMIAEKSVRTENLGELKIELSRHEKAEARQARVGDLQRQAARLKSQITEVTGSVEQRRTEVDAIRRHIAEVPAEVAKRLAETATRLEQARTDWMETNSDQRANSAAIAQLTEQLESIDEVGPDAVCERCRRPLGDDLPKIQKHLADELAQLQRKGTTLGEALSDRRREGDRLKAEVARLEKLDRSRREATVRAESLGRELEGLVSRRRSLVDQASELEETLAGLGEVPFDPARLAFVKQELARLERMALELSELKGELSRRSEVQAGRLRVSEQLSRLTAERDELQEQLANLGFDASATAAVSDEFAERQNELERARLAALEGTKEVEIAQREIAVREEELARLTEAGLKLEETRTDQFYAEKLVSLFTDFRKYTISRIRPRLAELSSQLITEMTDGRYSLVELDEDYNLQVMDSGKYFGIDRFSGGEKDLASLCLRLAISLALTESAGLERSFVILDEVFGSQDSGRRELIFRSLANLKERFPQIILVTHLEELKHRVETLIELVPQPGGWSEVRVNGEIA